MFSVMVKSFLFVIVCPLDHKSFISPSWQAAVRHTWESALLRFTAPVILAASGSRAGKRGAAAQCQTEII